jgi:LysR family transcriptional regulator, nitrogen assimilation regulatory protein
MPVAEADMVAMMLDLVRRDIGYTILPYSAIEESVRRGTHRASRIEGLAMSWAAAWQPERSHVPSVREAVDEMGRAATQSVTTGAWSYATLH